MQGGIKRPFFNPQGFSGELLDVVGHSVSVHRSANSERFEDQEIERSLQTIIRVFCHRIPIAGYRKVWAICLAMSSKDELEGDL